MSARRYLNGVIALLLLLSCADAFAVRLKDLARIEGDREIRLVGYGLVTGLAGSGDTERNKATRLALANALSHFRVTVDESELASRNTAAVIVTTSVSAFRTHGDRVDVQVSSLGDARSLQGGTLVMTALQDAGGRAVALAQGPVTTGAWTFGLNDTSVQKNHPTVGVVTRGATLELPVDVTVDMNGNANATGAEEKAATLALVLDNPDITTAQRVREALDRTGLLREVHVVHPGRVTFLPASPSTDVPALLARVESLQVEPDQPAQLVINERTGTLVAGGDIRLGRAVISQDDLRIEVNTEFRVSQPWPQVMPGADIATVTVPESDVAVEDSAGASPVPVEAGATVLDLVNALRRAHVPARSMVAIFQSLRDAGALNARILVQ